MWKRSIGFDTNVGVGNTRDASIAKGICGVPGGGLAGDGEESKGVGDGVHACTESVWRESCRQGAWMQAHVDDNREDVATGSGCGVDVCSRVSVLTTNICIVSCW
jgi:hypothetical protein